MGYPFPLYWRFTLWGTGGAVGPLVFARLKGSAIYVAAAMLIIGLLVTIAFKKPVAKGGTALI